MKSSVGLLLLVFVFIANNNNIVNACTTDDFECADGTCIDLTHRCDDSFECPDTSDEMNCSTPQLCPEGNHRCDTGECVNNPTECPIMTSILSLSSTIAVQSPVITETTQTLLPTGTTQSSELTLFSATLVSFSTAETTAATQLTGTKALPFLTDTKSSSLPIETTTRKGGDRPDEKKDQESEVNFTFLTFGLIVSAFVVTLVVSNVCNCLIQVRIRRSKKNTMPQIDVTSREPETNREGLYEVIEVETEMSLENITSSSNIRPSLSTNSNDNMGLPTSSNINISCLAETAQVISDTKDCSGSSHNSSISDASKKSNTSVSNETQYLNPYTVLLQNENTKREHVYNDTRSSVTSVKPDLDVEAEYQ